MILMPRIAPNCCAKVDFPAPGEPIITIFFITTKLSNYNRRRTEKKTKNERRKRKRAGTNPFMVSGNVSAPWFNVFRSDGFGAPLKSFGLLPSALFAQQECIRLQRICNSRMLKAEDLFADVQNLAIEFLRFCIAALSNVDPGKMVMGDGGLWVFRAQVKFAVSQGLLE